MDKLDVSLSVKAMFASIGGIISYIAGGLGYVTSVLIIFMMVDFVTAIMASKYNNIQIKSAIGIKGLIKKSYILILLFSVYLFEKISLNGLGMEHLNFTGDALGFMFCAIELVSIIENGIKMGAKMPKPIAGFLELASKILNNKP